jgi:multicomponent Na+:H+ antiporter subunit D
VSALFGGLLTKVGVYALFRTVSLMFAANVAFTLPVLFVIAGGTMFFGVLGALAQWDFKRVLSYHIVSQIGYMIMGLAIYTPIALAGGIFYIIHHILVKTALFLCAGTVEKMRGTTNLKRLGGVLESAPGLAALFMVAGLSLAGVPPLSGFVAKFMLIRGGLETGSYGIVTVSVVVSFLTLFSMMKIFRYAFWRDREGEELETTGNPQRILAIGVLVALGIVLGLGAAWMLPYAELAATQLLDTESYIEAVLGPAAVAALEASR